MTTTMERLTAALSDRYRIERELGAGGMATVYLAEDLKHGRKVALKVLKPELAAVLGAERFVVEIKTTAALQHPHILPLFDSGTADGFLFYVMPFIDGETLRDKLNRETQFSVEESVRITREVAEALHYAHTHGVIHRDIKPENILLANGRPTVADFGIALAVSAAAGGRMTETGLSLGTPHYMSPEQATAEKEITGRSDVYSLASVCYEMLTGNPPHVGSSAQQIIMRIITEQPEPVTVHRKTVPPHVAAAVAKALEKLPADRFESAEKFAEALANPAFTTLTSAGAVGSAHRGSRGALLTVTAIAAVATVAATVFALRPVPDAPVLRFQLALPDSQMPVPGAHAAVPAPDGSFLIYNGPVFGEPALTQLWIKRRESPVATPIPGTHGAGNASISPDGKRIAFDNSGRLLVLPITGGVGVVLHEPAVQPQGVAWLDDEHVLFTAPPPNWPSLLDIFVVSAAGGPAHALGLNSDSRVAVRPKPVHGRDAFVYLSCSTTIACDVHVFDFRDSTSKSLMPGSLEGTYVPSGHLLFERGGALVASRFDAATLALEGDAVLLEERLNLALGANPVSVALDGTMALLAGGGNDVGIPQQLVWVDRRGRQTLVDSTMRPVRMTLTGNNHGWALSPDGRRLAIGLATPSGDDIWVKQLPNGALTRVTLDAIAEFRPQWSPDGQLLVYPTISDVRMRRSDGTGRDSVLYRGQVNEVELTPDGTWLIIRAGAASSIEGGRDILAMQLGVDTTLRPLLASPAHDETAPSVSPDGNWLLYQSNESGRREIYVRPFPDVDRLRVQVSVGGGEAPLWSTTGREIFWLSQDRRMMAASFADGATPSVSTPQALFPVPRALLGAETAFMAPWDVAADGRFLMSRTVDDLEANAPVHVITYNLFTELRQRLGK